MSKEILAQLPSDPVPLRDQAGLGQIPFLPNHPDTGCHKYGAGQDDRRQEKEDQPSVRASFHGLANGTRSPAPSRHEA
jgi:hypothetical protein